MATVLLIGPGAIGAYLGARLAAARHEVYVVCRTDATAERLAKTGLTAKEADGTSVVGRVQVVRAPEELLAVPDVVLLATKCADAEAALAPWAPEVPDDRPIVALQNGLMGDRLLALARGRLVESVVAFPATLEGTGTSLRTGPGGLIIGPWPPSGDGPHPSLVAKAAAILEDAVPTEISADITGAKWTKLVINSCITSLGVLTGRDLGALLVDRQAREVFLRITTEGHDTGCALGVRFVRVQRFSPGLFAYRDGQRSWLARFWRHLLLRFIGRRHRRQRSSSLQSLERGGKTEVDELNGAIVRAAVRAGVAAPVNAAVVALVHEIESGARRPGLENLASLPA